MRRKVLCAVALTVATTAAYWPLRQAEFLNFDDPTYVTNNPQVLQGLSLPGVAWAFSSVHACFWHPLTWLSHMLDCQVFGQRAGGHHLVNLFFHVANSLVLLGVLQGMTGAFWRSAMVAGLFALHPLHVESVAWIAERKDVLSTLFFLLTVGAYARYAQPLVPGGAARGGWQARGNKPEVRHLKAGALPHSAFRTPHSPFWYGLALICFVLGLMSKPMLVTLPFVLLLLDYWPLQRLPIGTTQGAHALLAFGRLVKEKWPFFLLSVAASVLTYIAEARGGALSNVDVVPLQTRALNAVICYTAYLAKTFWPVDLTVIYPFTGAWPLWNVVLALVVLAGSSLLALAGARRFPYLFVGWFWYVGMLVPVIGIVQVGVHAMADRYTYLPLIGLFIPIVWGAAALLQKGRFRPAFAGALSCATLIACAVATRCQSRYWHDNERLFSRAIQINPQCWLAHHHLGLACLTAGNGPEAIQHLNEAIRLEPNYPRAWFARGTAFALAGDLAQAARDFREALRLKPDFHQAYFQMGKVLAMQSRLEEARTNFLEAVRRKPDYAEAQTLLGNVLLLQGKVDEAVPHLTAAITAEPRYGEGHYYLSTALARQGKFQEAAAHLETAITCSPNLYYAFNDLALILVTQTNAPLRDVPRGVRIAEKACQLSAYQDPACLQTLAIAYAEAGRFNDAVESAERALALAPSRGNDELVARLRSQLSRLQQGMSIRMQRPGSQR